MLKVSCLCPAAVLLLMCFSGSSRAQEHGGTQSLGISSTYSPDSSHILIGDSQQRRIWTAGVEYTHRLYRATHVQLDYAGTLSPFFQESDPTVTGTQTVLAGATIVSPQTPVRVVAVDRNPVGTAIAGPGLVSPIYATYSRQDSYAVSLLPLGLRVNALQQHRVQPTFTVDAGFIVSSNSLPVDNAARFNYVFGFGPGIQIFSVAHSALRLEYLYRHISNAGAGEVNPGIDQGVVRLTLSHYR